MMKKIPKSMIIMAVIILASSALLVTYATGDTNNPGPDLTITINENQQYISDGNHLITKDENGITVEGNIFNTDEGDVFNGHSFNGKWYPGKEKSGIIRIVNNYQDGSVTIDGLDVNIIEFKESYTREEVETSFLKYMVLTLDGKGLISNNIIDNKTLLNIKANGIAANKFSVPANSSVDLEYKLSMHKDAGNELQRVKASIDFLLNVSGDEPSNTSNYKHSHRSSNNNDNENNNLELDSKDLAPTTVEKFLSNDEGFLQMKFPVLLSEDGSKILLPEQKNVGIKIVSMVKAEEQIEGQEEQFTEQLIASCSIGVGSKSLSLSENYYIYNFDTRNYQLAPNVTYTAYLYDIDTGEILLEPVNFNVVKSINYPEQVPLSNSIQQ